MLKLAGAALVVAASGALGAMSAKRLAERAAALAAFQRALELMRSEICARLTPLPEVMALLAGETEEPARSFFALCVLKEREKRGGPFAAVWSAALASLDGIIGDAGTEAMRELGGTLGRFDAERQGEVIAAAGRRIGALLEKAELERAREGRSRAAIGLAAGAAMAIIFI